MLRWHGDVKPSNILKVRDRWKLIDPGFASITNKSEHAIHLRRQPLSYAPPEAVYSSNHPIESIMRSADIWSLGCVYSIAATWVVLGGEGVAKYTAYRINAFQEASSQSGSIRITGDFFHDSSKVLDAVIQWHRFLREHVRKSDSITGQVLDMIDEMMFVKWEDRCSAKEICQRLAKSWHKYDQAKDNNWGWSEWGDMLERLDWKEYELPVREKESWILERD